MNAGAYVEVRHGGRAFASRARAALRLAGWKLTDDPERAALAVLCAGRAAGAAPPDAGLLRVLVTPAPRARVGSAFDLVVAPRPAELVEAARQALDMLARLGRDPRALEIVGPGLVRAGARTARVTQIEEGILRRLAEARGALVTPAELLRDARAWGLGADPCTNRVASAIYRLRRNVPGMRELIGSSPRGYWLRGRAG